MVILGGGLSAQGVCVQRCVGGVCPGGGVGVYVQGGVHPPESEADTPIACWDTHPPPQCMLGYTSP